MSEKRTAFLVTAAIVCPMCAVCILGPAGLFAFFGSATAWLSALGILGGVVVGSATAALCFLAIKTVRTKTRQKTYASNPN
ncbi:MAG TPA: hypothetical protein EYO32_04470 [Rhodospirillales bacterium]|jgi:hypothetical protein|nr:hypothetical protein [Rhodospirillales bacterium]HIB20780.1 hypothetical protein [Rhodospirillales bacterium]